MPLDASQVQWDEAPQQPKPRLRYDAPENVEAIRAAATDLGIDPVDLATAISYETAGTFDPDQPGPTTKWGQHRGLIQFGEPQRAKYGVREGMTIPEQMPAVVAYLRDAGVKPGMGMLDVYSAINAGGPGRYNASDAAAGGAPGTVADKVNTQMGAHRKRAEALLGGVGGGGGSGAIDLSKVQWDAAPAIDPAAAQLDTPAVKPDFNSVTVDVRSTERMEKPSLLQGVVGRGAQLLSKGVRGVANIAEPVGDWLESKLPLSGLTPEQIQGEKQLQPLYSLADTIGGFAERNQYQPTVDFAGVKESLNPNANANRAKMAEEFGEPGNYNELSLGDRLKNVGTFIGEQAVLSLPDMAAAVATLPGYVLGRTEEIAERRVQNDASPSLSSLITGEPPALPEPGLGDLAAAAPGAIIESMLERFGTKRLLPGGVPGAGSVAGRIAKETGVQAGTEALEEGAANLAESVGTERGVDSGELMDAMGAGALVGGPIGSVVQGGKEAVGAIRSAIDLGQVQWDDAAPANDIPPTPDNAVPPTPSAPTAAAPPSAGPDTSPDGPVAAGAEATPQVVDNPPVATGAQPAEPVAAATAPAEPGAVDNAVASATPPVAAMAAAPAVSTVETPAAPRTRFSSPEDITRGEFLQRAQAVGVEPQVAEQLAPKAQVDDVTGWYDGRAQGVKANTVQRAQEHVRSTGESAFYVDGDIVNLGGLNAFAKNDMGVANQHFRAMTDLLRGELEAVGADVVPMRTGGDEIGAVVVNAGEPEIRAAMQRADAKIRDYARAQGLDQVPHTKAGRTDVGVGLHLGLAPIIPELSLDEIFTRASAELNQSKEASNVAGIQTQVAGPVAPGRQAGGAAGSAEPTGAGDRPEGGEPAAQSGPAQAPEPGDEGAARQVTPPDDDTPGPGIEIRYGKRRAAPMGRMPRTEDAIDDRRTATGTDDATSARGAAEDEADLMAELDEQPQANQGGTRGTAPETMRVSFTNRRSWAEQAWNDAGVDPDTATNWPIDRQFATLTKLVKDRFGVTVKKSETLQGRFAVDQLLDLYRNLQFMAHVLGMPHHAIGLNESLHLVFRKAAHYFGAFYPQAARVEGVTFPAGTVVLPRRSNSFAHEWMHVLDFHMMRKFAGDDAAFALLSQQVRGKGLDSEAGSTKEAFVKLMTTIFFDQASLAQKILALELRIGDPEVSTSEKKKLEAQLENFRKGNARPKDVKSSEYRASSAGFGDPRYWANPQELLARAFEAYTAFKVEAAGGTTEAIAKGDMAYLSNADKRLAETFPKGDDRFRIFTAFERLFEAMAKEQLIADGVAAGVPGNSQLFDPRTWDKTPARRAEYTGLGGAVRQTLDEMRVDWQTRQRQKERPKNPKSMGQRIQDTLRYPLYAQRSVFRMLERRYPKSRALRELADNLVTAPGRARVVERVFEEAVEQRIKVGFNRLGNIVERHDLQKLDSAGLRQLRDLLISEDVADAPAGLKAAASELRKFLDTEWYRNQQAGLDIGYARNGYLPRLLDMARVMTDRDGFVDKATKVYEIIFDTEFGADAEAVVARGESYSGVIDFLRQAKLAGLDVKPALRQVRKLRELERKPDVDKARVDEGKQRLVELVDGLYDQTRSAHAKRRAEHWSAALMTTAVQDFDTMSPDSKYTKSRKLPPQADKLMEDFYINDPIEAVQHYLFQSARRTEYATRFGAKGEKLQAKFDAMTQEGVTPEDQAYIADMVTNLTGRSKTGLPPAFAGFLNFLHAIGTMMLLPRAVLSSIGEPTAAAVRSGNLADTFKPYANLVKQVVGTADAKDWAEISRVIGAVSSSFADTVASNRFGGTFDNTFKSDAMLSRFFKRSMLSGLTNAQRTAVLPLAHQYLLHLADRIRAGRDVENSRALLAELGIRDIGAFSDWILQSEAVPTIDELYDNNGVETPHGAEWATAVNRYLDQVIQNPKGYDRPLMANTPAGRLMYGILSFSMSFYANVWKRQAALVRGIAQRQGVAPAVGYAALQMVPSLAALYLVQLMVSTMREAIFNPERWEEWEKDGVLQERLMQLGLTRAFAFGLVDPVVQAFTGLKYQRDLSNVMIGAVPGYIMQSLQGLLQPLVQNSEKTNNAEYKAAQSAFQLTASPAIVYALSMAPGGKLADPLYGMAMMYLASPATRDKVAEALVGEKDSKRKARERDEKRASGSRSSGRSEGRGTGR